MSLNKKSVDDINVKGLRVLCRCDFNVPLKDGKIGLSPCWRFSARSVRIIPLLRWRLAATQGI